MRSRIVLAAAIFQLFVVSGFAEDPTYSKDVKKWLEVPVPSHTNQSERVVWSYAANCSEYHWQVFLKNDQPLAQLKNKSLPKKLIQPNFIPAAGQFHEASSFAQVSDGWLVGFNEGEFGAALYWFSQNGKRNYKISDDQIVDFFSLSNMVYAIEGLAHMGMSLGSVISINRANKTDRWQAANFVKLPFAPYTVSVKKDGVMLITLSDALVSIGSDRKVKTILEEVPEVPWSCLYPTSSILSTDERKLYLGMRQFVGEIDLNTKKLRLLIPSINFLNKLPKEDEDRIRKAYSR